MESLSNRLKGKIMILGVGNSLRGDDGAGPYLVSQLKGKVRASLIDCEEVPENFLGKIIEEQPDSILIVDAIDLRKSSGEVALLEEGKLRDTGWSTHYPSLQLFINCLKVETEARVFVLGIQPRFRGFGSEISNEVKETLHLLEGLLVKALASGNP